MDLDELEARLSAAVSECERLIGVAKAQLAEGDDKARHHDEAMRMQALAIGARVAAATLEWPDGLHGSGQHSTLMLAWAAWAYREATGREW
ncbi:MAG: hypothetical protein AB7O44_32385 [Hyphomicrobiaceae bacterium]